MKKFFTVFAAFVMVLSCQKIEKSQDYEENFPLKSDLGKIENELEELEEIHHFLTENLNSYFLNYGYDEFESFVDALIEEDEDELLKYFNLTENEFLEINIKLEDLGDKIKDKKNINRDDLKDICLFCGKMEFLESYDNRLFPEIDLFTHQRDEVDCSWVQYSIALVGCTFSGPWGYWLCSYLALCAYCEGGWVDNTCD